jgi:hypothetical protein
MIRRSWGSFYCDVFFIIEITKYARQQEKKINISFFRFQFSVVIVSTEEQWLIFLAVLSLSLIHIFALKHRDKTRQTSFKKKLVTGSNRLKT